MYFTGCLTLQNARSRKTETIQIHKMNDQHARDTLHGPNNLTAPRPSPCVRRHNLLRTEDADGRDIFRTLPLHGRRPKSAVDFLSEFVVHLCVIAWHPMPLRSISKRSQKHPIGNDQEVADDGKNVTQRHFFHSHFKKSKPFWKQWKLFP